MPLQPVQSVSKPPKYPSKYSQLIRTAASVIFFAFPAVAVLLIWHQNNPFPYPLNWDLYEHQTLINQILKGHFSLIPSHLTDTFTINGYTPLFHLVLSFFQAILRVKPLQFWWLTEIVFFAATVFVSAWLGWEVTQNKWTTFFSGMLGALIFESYIAYSSLFLIPQTVAGLLTIVAMIRLCHLHNHQKAVFDTTQGGLILIILLTHYIVGLAGTLILLLTTLALKYKDNKILGISLPDLVLLISIFTLFLTYILNFYTTLNFMGTPESIHFNLNLEQKWELIKKWYSYSAIVLFSGGAFSTLRVEKDKPIKLLLAATSLVLALVVAPIPYSVKFYVIGRYLVHLFMAISLTKLISLAKFKWLRIALAVLTTITFIVVFYVNQAKYKSIAYYQGTATHVSNNEVEASQFLKEKYAGNTQALLVSDPATQYILEALSKVNTPGGAYTNQSTRRLLIRAYQTQGINQEALFEIRDALEPIPPKTLLLVLSGRFFAWQNAGIDEKLAIYFNIWAPKDLTFKDKVYIRKVEKQAGLKKVFANKGLVIFEVTRNTQGDSPFEKKRRHDQKR